MALWMCIPGAFFPLTQAAMCFIFVCQTDFLSSFLRYKVLLFNLMVANFMFCYFLISVLALCFLVLHMHGETLQNGQSWPGRKICTFSIFVLCTALLILNPIIYYLNPSMKKNLLKRSLCVYVNNTKKVSTLEKDKKKSLWRKRASVLMPWWLQQMTSEEFCPPTICSCGFAIQAWSVINRNKRCVLCSLYLSLVWMHRLKIK